MTLYQALKAEWSALQALEAGPLEKGNGQFGKSVSMTENAETVLVGAPHESFKAGAVWLFGKRPTVEELQLGESKGKAKGKLDGGNKLTIIGTNLKEATAVWFGSNKAAGNRGTQSANRQASRSSLSSCRPATNRAKST